MERSKSIDILRAVAFFLVCFGRHLNPSPDNTASAAKQALHQVTLHLQTGGWIGVDLFFVLSGFLVSGLLFREHQKYGAISPSNFLIRRGLKIYPAFWLLMIVTIFVAPLFNQKLEVKQVVSEFLFVQNYGPFFWWHTWSLAVEEHFYLLLLLLLFGLSKQTAVANPFRRIPMIFLGLAVVSLCLRLFVTQGREFDFKGHFVPSHLRMDSLFCGVMISYLYHYYPDRFMAFARRYRLPLAAGGVLALLPAFFLPLETTRFIYTFGFTLFYLGAGALLVAALAVQVPDRKIFTFTAYLGSHSYSIYLWHLAVAIWIVPLLRDVLRPYYWGWPLYFVIYFTMTLAIGVLMSVLVEFPVLRIRNKWFPSRARPLGVVPEVSKEPAVQSQTRGTEVYLPSQGG